LTTQQAAYMRQFSDIPFASDVAELMHSREVCEALLRSQQIAPADSLWYAPIFEVRYKSVTEAIRRTGNQLVLYAVGKRVELEKRGEDAFYAALSEFDHFLLYFRRETANGEGKSAVVEVWYGEGWYTNSCYSGPLTFHFPEKGTPTLVNTARIFPGRSIISASSYAKVRCGWCVQTGMKSRSCPFRMVPSGW
jgi:hypothetical protein